MTKYLHGLHDPGGEHLMADKPGWIVFTESIGSDPNQGGGRDYSAWSDAGFGVIVRLNNGYGAGGTIPLPSRYEDFAQRCANWVRDSKGCNKWIIGNEPNHSQEWPEGQPIRWNQYVACFMACHAAIHTVQPNAEVLIAGIAPWNVESGDWLIYFGRICEGLKFVADGIAMHTYTHGSDPALVTSGAKMDAPFDDYFYNFMAYLDFLSAVPEAMQSLPVYITEANQDDPWLDQDNGWMLAALHEIAAWNKEGHQQIYCVCFYRWLDHDRWAIEDKMQVRGMFRRAAKEGVRSPAQLATHKTPDMSGNEDSESNMSNKPAAENPYIPKEYKAKMDEQVRYVPTIEWDERLTDPRGVVIEPAKESAAYRVVQGRWYDVNEVKRIGPDHHILVDVLDANGKRLEGKRVRFFWPGGSVVKGTEAKPGQPYAVDFPMSPSRNEFGVAVDGPPSDRVVGIGMGADMGGGFNASHHTSTLIVFQWVEGAVEQADEHKVYVPIVQTPQDVPGAPKPAQPAQPDANGYTTMPADGYASLGQDYNDDVDWILVQLAKVAGIDPILVKAFLLVESGGVVRAPNMIIRLEPHILRSKVDADWFDANFRVGEPAWDGTHHRFRDPDDGLWKPFHGNQAREYQALRLAVSQDPEAAMQSISMGAGQIMGFNHDTVGYPSALAMYKEYSDARRGVIAQVFGFYAYVMNRNGLRQAMQNKDYLGMAKMYNGEGQAAFYATLIQNKVQELRGQLDRGGS